MSRRTTTVLATVAILATVAPAAAVERCKARQDSRDGTILVSAGHVSGTPEPRWNNDDLRALTQLTGADFDVVDESALMLDPDSGQVR